MARRKQKSARSPQQRLELFVRRVSELSQESLISGTAAASLTIQYNQTEGLRIASAPVDEARRRSFVLLWRRFVSESEPTYLHGVFGLCHQHLSDATVKGYVTDAQRQWKEIQKRTGLNLIVDGQEMTPEHVADLLVNGHYFHDDEDLLDELDHLIPLQRTLIDSQFMFFLLESTKVVLWLGNTVRIALRDGMFTF